MGGFGENYQAYLNKIWRTNSQTSPSNIQSSDVSRRLKDQFAKTNLEKTYYYLMDGVELTGFRFWKVPLCNGLNSMQVESTARCSNYYKFLFHINIKKVANLQKILMPPFDTINTQAIIIDHEIIFQTLYDTSDLIISDS